MSQSLKPYRTGKGIKARTHHYEVKFGASVYGSKRKLQRGVFVDDNLVIGKTYGGQFIIGYLNDSHSTELNTDQMHFLCFWLLHELNEMNAH